MSGPHDVEALIELGTNADSDIKVGDEVAVPDDNGFYFAARVEAKEDNGTVKVCMLE